MPTLYGPGDRVRVRTITSEMEAVVVSDEVVRDELTGRDEQLCISDHEARTGRPPRLRRILGRVERER